MSIGLAIGTHLGRAGVAAIALPRSLTRFQRYRTTPVVTKGDAAFNTGAGVNVANWALDALAAPSVCRDAAGTGWAMVLSGWNNTDAKWRSGFFTSPDLETWAFVANSVQAPGGGNYILGNGGIICIGGTYHHYYNEYPSASTPSAIKHATSTDLATWTVQSTSIIPLGAVGSGDVTQQADPSVALNPTTGLYELWYIGQDTATYPGVRPAMLATSPDGTTWTKQGRQGGPASGDWNASNYGEPASFYRGGFAYVTTDGASPRNTDLAVRVGATWRYTPHAHVPANNAWETTMVFDAYCVGALDRGDGRGTRLWMLYAGSAINSATDNTQSSIGLVSAALPPATAATAPFLVDTFQGAAADLATHTSDSGHTWATHPFKNHPLSLTGAARVVPMVTPNVSCAYASAIPASADYDVTADFYLIGASNAIGLLGRLDTVAETGYLLWYDHTVPGFKLYKNVAGTLTQLGSTYTATLVAGCAVRCTLRLRGTTVSAIIDGVQQISVTDTTITTAGHVGLYGYGNALQLANLEATAA